MFVRSERNTVFLCTMDLMTLTTDDFPQALMDYKENDNAVKILMILDSLVSVCNKVQKKGIKSRS